MDLTSTPRVKKMFLFFGLLLASVLVSGCLHQATTAVDNTAAGGDLNLGTAPPPPPDGEEGDFDLADAPPPPEPEDSEANNLNLGTAPPPPDPEDDQVNNDEPTAAVKEFDMVAKRWNFTPSTITVNKGDTVRMIINSLDVKHGFSIPQFGVNAEINPGKITTIEFVADKSGSFRFFCTVFCGSGHGGMEGTLIVN